MEEVSNRFPSLVHMILENVDNESLVKFKETSREMSEFLINDRFYWIRILKKHGKYFKEFADSWKKVIDKTPVKIVKELAMTVEDYFNYSLYNDDDYQLHPLHIAAEGGRLQLCRHIVEKTDDFNPKLHDRVTALHIAAELGHLEIYQFILNNVDDKHPVDIYGNTPYRCAVDNNQLEMCRFIMKTLDDKNPIHGTGLL